MGKDLEEDSKHDYSGAGGGVEDTGKMMRAGRRPLWGEGLGPREQWTGWGNVYFPMHTHTHTNIQGTSAAVGEGGSVF